MTQSIYKFGRGISTGMFDARIVGGKGAKLAEMGSLALPVPPGVTITTAKCNEYLNAPSTALIADIVDGVLENYEDIISTCGYMPLVSVRSGSRVSMPGMMDTVLNVGINENNYSAWCMRLGTETATDCYKRFMVMYAEVVLGIPTTAFATCLTLESFVTVYKKLTGGTTPRTLEEQLEGSIAAVFNSWNSDRAVAYRATHGYADDWGTAVTVQQMVFGNRNTQSCSGVLFSRDFNTGEQSVIIDWLPNAQGEDVVAGTHDTKTTDELGQWNTALFALLIHHAKTMEAHYRDMQDMEFTIDNGELFILQTRDGKRSALAAFKIAHDLEASGMIDKVEMLTRVTAKQYIALQSPTIDPSFTKEPCISGIGASGKIVTGIAVLSSADAVNCTEDCILVTKETTPKDFPGMMASVGILTKTGGVTSHAAVVARGMNKACVVGAENLKFAGLAGKRITMNGETGDIWVDTDVPVLAGNIPDFVEVMINSVDTTDSRLLSVRPESVPNDETVYVDVSATISTQKALTKALKAIKASNSNGVLGFGRNMLMQEVDSEFIAFFGVNVYSYPTTIYSNIEKVLGRAMWTKKFKKQWTLHLPSGVDKVFVVALQAQGWKVVTLVNSFKTALSVDGYVVMGDDFTIQLKKENMSFKDIEKLIVSAGNEVKELPDRVTKERQLFDVLGG